MKSSHYYKLLVFALSLATTLRAADFGDIPANLTLGAGTSVRRNAGNTLFEAYTPTTGTVTSFSAGDLSPLFTTTESTVTTTPALSFSLSNAAAHKFFGNNTGSTAAPGFQSIGTADLPSLDTLLGLTPSDTGIVIHGGPDFLSIQPSIALSGEVSGSGLSSIPTTQTHFVTFSVDGSGDVLTTGVQHPYKTKYGGTLVGWTAMCKPIGSVTIDIFRAVDGAGLPTASIVGGGGTKPAISSNVEASGTSFSGWTSTTINPLDNLGISLSGVSTATYLEITLWFK